MMAQVADASGDHPAMALEVLEIVVRQDERELREPHLISAETILAQASEHPDLKAQARQVADTLARAGYEQFERFCARRRACLKGPAQEVPQRLFHSLR